MSTPTPLPLNDPAWAELSHAYGSAADIPALLRTLSEFPPASNHQDEPWFTLWSSLCHQGDVYSGSFAAVPHIIEAAKTDPERATYDYFLLPTCIEIARVKKAVPVPEKLEIAYFDSLRMLPSIVAQNAAREWNESVCSSALAAIAAAKKHPHIAEIILELEGDTVPAVHSFLENR